MGFSSKVLIFAILLLDSQGYRRTGWFLTKLYFEGGETRERGSRLTREFSEQDFLYRTKFWFFFPLLIAELSVRRRFTGKGIYWNKREGLWAVPLAVFAWMMMKMNAEVLNLLPSDTASALDAFLWLKSLWVFSPLYFSMHCTVFKCYVIV